MATTLEDILDELYFTATSESDKGTKFERLMAAYLRTDPQYADQFDEVWPWMEWPDRDGQGDHGIDLVARERDTGDLVAIQCKFYDPRGTLHKPDIDSFLSASGKHPFRRRIIVSTTDKWGHNAEAAIHGQQIPVQRIRFKDLADSAIDWSQFSLATPEVLELKDHKRLRQHQTTAIADVIDGFKSRDRGKLIMACGTGKTFTSLRLAEQIVGAGGSVLFLVPSIALLSQSLREWTGEAEVDLQAFAVCSDPKVSKMAAASSEDISSVDLPLAATTNPDVLHERLTAAVPGRMRVVFATYQSIDVVARAQAMGGVDPFDLIVCDEAHRTTGVTLVDADESAFVKVHDAEYILGARRLYMTATPRVYGDNTKVKAGEADAILASMDDEALYGPEFHRLGFGKAVSQGLLTDYKVLVLGVSEDTVSKTFQAQLADETLQLRLDDVAKMVGCWNGLAKRGESGFGFGDDVLPMQRAVAFAQDIAASKAFAEKFTRITNHYIASHDFDAEFDDDENEAAPDRALRCEVDHVDGGMNALMRNDKLDWLRADLGPDTARILSNARCLSEGVDVPALDAVLFLNPRNSQVDVIQSVGRVMRLAPDKKYGYIILPVAVPAGVDPETALSSSRFKVVWDVLQALRAHDERFDAMINQIDLNKAPGERLEVIFTDMPTGTEDETGQPETKIQQFEQTVLDLPAIGEWRDAIYAKIVAKVGTRRYWEDWAADIRQIAEQHTTRITSILAQPTPELQEQFDAFLTGLRGNLNESISRTDAIEMLSQHLITKPVFDALFEGYSFAEHNPVSRVMQTMIDALHDQNLETETQTLEGFYESVRLRAAGIENAAGKQKIITELYESFFKNAFPKTAESLGIVYTPTQVVDFILRSVETVLQTEFGASISDEGVHVLDPFTGTGTFLVRLLESGLIRPDDLLRKYTQELHANELLLLAYYIGAINIEATLHGLLREADPNAGYVPFDGMVLTDTFQMTEDGDTMDAVMFPANNARVEAQKALDIRVIIGNPPYSVGQTSGNDANANLKYPTLDKHIETTYAARSTATNKNSLYDSYIRAIRWASDRIGDEGVIGYVANGGWIDSNTADGLRKTLADEFSAIYVYNLRGNQRTAGEQSRREGGKIFGSGSRNTVTILLLVRKRGNKDLAKVHYRDIGDYLTREDKLRIVDESRLEALDWQIITPNAHGDWINQRDDYFSEYAPIGSKRSEPDVSPIFETYSQGLQTNRDAWVYNSSTRALKQNVRRTVDAYNAQVDDFTAQTAGMSARDAKSLVDDFIDTDPTKISWSRSLKSSLVKRMRATFSEERIVTGVYRPFTKQRVYFDALLNHERAQQPRFFPTPDHTNLGFVVISPRPGTDFAVLAVDALPDLSFFTYAAQFFPRWTFETRTEPGDLFGAAAETTAGQYQRIDNITDAILDEYREAYGAEVSKDDVFYYVYGLLHSPDYRQRYAADLKKMLPRIPQVTTADDFRAFVAAGRELAAMHVGYEAVEPYPLTETVAGTAGDDWELYRIRKMRYPGVGKSKDRSTIIFNAHVTLAGIPDDAHRYMLGSRSALEWLIERYQVKTDKPSGIVNDPNDWAREVGDPRYILDLVKRVVTVSVKTMKIVDVLPTLRTS
ncbi:putative helicase [Georgenia soli]|uniref:Putative helicase n=1 Tax=Georgenia soli TaxID=638953 RepID=A0A2A9F3J6_9MICO|nr:DEAD/DEAH box helicase [Georgenia soli]PFG45025.1 putative helicase [Georgenia soli]